MVTVLRSATATSGDMKSEVGKCKACGFKPRCLPALLDDERLADFEGSISRRAHPIRQDQVLVRQGDPLDALFALRIGTLKARITTPEGNERIVGFRFPGTVIGLAEPENRFWARTFIAVEDSWICRIPVAVINDDVRRQLVRLMSESLRDEFDYHLSVAARKSSSKVAAFLLGISDNCRKRHLSPNHFTLPMLYSDVANYLGMRHESICRTFSSLERDGLVAREGRHIDLPDLEALRAFCEQ